MLFDEHRQAIYRRTDRMFAVLLAVQYVAGVVAAWVISPKTWEGSQSAPHIHLWAAVILGFIIVSLPIALAILAPGKTYTRHAIAIGQMIDSALLIHLTGGRIETHFHVFGSLAFLGFYRDWRVLVSASTVVAVDHFFRGLYWPQSVYGILAPSSWRWLEHTAWVLFEDIFIFMATAHSTREMKEIANTRAQIELKSQERKRSIAHLQDVETQLKEALDARDTFLSICSHELKTPLTSMRLQSEIVARKRKSTQTGEPTEQMSLFATQIGRQVDRIERLVEDMLDVSRIASKKLSFSPEWVNLGELTSEVIQRLRPFAERMGCEIDCSAQGAIVGWWDRFRIEQVVTNLLTNSCKYGQGLPIEVSVSQKDGTAQIKVRDNGMGIQKKDQEKIFQKFERVAQQTNISGVGLGLFISKNIVEQHGGSIYLQSEPGKGTTFIVSLPISQAAREATPQISAIR